MVFVYFMLVDLETVQTKLVAHVIQKQNNEMETCRQNSNHNNTINRPPSHQLFSVQFRFENKHKNYELMIMTVCVRLRSFSPHGARCCACIF